MKINIESDFQPLGNPKSESASAQVGIIEEGEVAPGDRIQQVEQAGHDWTVARTFKLLIGGGNKKADAFAQLQVLAQLEALAESWRIRAAKLAAQL
ncbi:MAG: hypothetical protein CFE36_08150 [Sphingomonadaceae bacterium PASS1]|nr:MAG: hypothetical protein CFE36_08150 [Sphingomonadaceae bacterium PASS1]